MTCSLCQNRKYRVHKFAWIFLGKTLSFSSLGFLFVISATLFSALGFCRLFSSGNCFVTFFRRRRRRRVAINQFFVSNAVQNKVPGLICHWHFVLLEIAPEIDLHAHSERSVCIKEPPTPGTQEHRRIGFCACKQGGSVCIVVLCRFVLAQDCKSFLNQPVDLLMSGI